MSSCFLFLFAVVAPEKSVRDWILEAFVLRDGRRAACSEPAKEMKLSWMSVVRPSDGATGVICAAAGMTILGDPPCFSQSAAGSRRATTLRRLQPEKLTTIKALAVAIMYLANQYVSVGACATIRGR
jgi:hypothetical protein